MLGGADFGGGLWDLLAGGDRRGRAPRALIEESITPVWEANHVWLVFDLVIFWTAFPHAFAPVMTVAALPLWLALAGIVLRGAGFAFRKEVSGLGAQRAFGAIFAFSSLLTPFFMGTVIGAIATGQVPAGASHASLAAWTSATSLLTGFVFTGACGYLAAVYLAGEAACRGDGRLQAYFTRRAQAAGIVTGALSLATLAELHTSNAALFSRLTGRALPLVIAAGLCGVAVLALLTAGQLRGVRVIAAARRGRRDLGLGRRPVPGAAARHRGDPEQRGRPGYHPGRDRGPVRRGRGDRGAIVRAAVLACRAAASFTQTTAARCWPPSRPASPCRRRDRSRLPPLPPPGPRSSPWSSPIPSSGPSPAGEPADPAI